MAYVKVFVDRELADKRTGQKLYAGGIKNNLMSNLKRD